MLTHLLLLGILGITSFDPPGRSSIFDVDIVGPVEEYRPPAPEKVEPPVIKPPVIKRKPPVVRRRRLPPDRTSRPETMFGTGTSREGSKKQDTPDLPAGPDDMKSANNNVPSLPAEKGDRTVSPEKEGPSLVPPSSLFDRNTIEEFARRGLTDRKDSSAQKGLTFDTSEFRHRGYMRMLKEKIEDIWKYPREAEQQRVSGDLYIKFSIRKDGHIGKVELVRTSGYRFLDEAAMKAIKDGSPYWPLPDDWEEDDLEITGHFIYIFGGAFVM